MQIDTIKELTQIERELVAIIAQEQDDVTNGYLVDMYDAAGGALKRLNEIAYVKFQENPA